MTRTINIILQDDTEILGNGLGHVMTRQYLPVKNYINILTTHKVISTFFIDMAHYLFLKANQNLHDFKIQLHILEETILLLLKTGMDVQLHLHPQWLDANYSDNHVLPIEKWNLGKLPEPLQSKLISESLAAFDDLFDRSGISHKICAFKAGAWGLQPFKSLGKIFKTNHINLVLGPKKGLKIPQLGIDYSTMEEDVFPYYCNLYNFNQIGKSDDKLIIIPITPTYLTWTDLLRYAVHIKWKRLESYFDHPIDIDSDPHLSQIKFPDVNEQRKIRLSFRPITTHLKMNSQPYWYLKNTFDKAIDYVKKSNTSYPLIVIETHTKDFKNRFRDINKFFQYVTLQYPEVNFISITELLEDIESGLCVPKSK